MAYASLLLALQSENDGVFLPEDGGSTLVWVLFIGVVAALYVLVSRTRRRAVDEYWERKRREDEATELPEPDDPTQLP